MNYRAYISTIKGKCVSCGKNSAQCPRWDHCLHERVMKSNGKRPQMCQLCGISATPRDLVGHTGACIERYERRVEELRKIPDLALADVINPEAMARKMERLAIEQRRATDGVRESASTDASAEAAERQDSLAVPAVIPVATSSPTLAHHRQYTMKSKPKSQQIRKILSCPRNCRKNSKRAWQRPTVRPRKRHHRPTRASRRTAHFPDPRKIPMLRPTARSRNRNL